MISPKLRKKRTISKSSGLRKHGEPRVVLYVRVHDQEVCLTSIGDEAVGVVQNRNSAGRWVMRKEVNVSPSQAEIFAAVPGQHS